jgi:hypothetical protein
MAKKKKKKQPTAEEARARRVLLWLAVLAGAVGFLLYANTLDHGYAYDDGMVIGENRFVREGVGGIPEIFANPRLRGHWEEGKPGGYRPLPLAMFAVEWELAPNSPRVGHFLNVALYGLTAALLFLVLCRLLAGRKGATFIAFFTSLLYAAHPLHTEVVANIKSRDEILAFLLGLLCILFLWRFFRLGSVPAFALSVACLFLALLSKENAITLVGAVPLAVYFFTDSPVRRILKIAAAYVGAAAVYLGIRIWVLAGIPKEIAAHSVLDNSLQTATGLFDRLASAVLVLGRYLKLLVFPHHLTWDYGYLEVPVVTFADPWALLSLVAYGAILVVAIVRIRRKETFVFGIWFYLVTLSVVANIFLLVGAAMAERFLYMPSAGFCLVVIVGLMKLTAVDGDPPRPGLRAFFQDHWKFLCILLPIVVLFSVRTVTRNQDWSDTYSLFAAGVDRSRSARVHFSYGREVLRRYQAMPQGAKVSAEGRALLDEASHEISKAVTIFDEYTEAHMNLGICRVYQGDYQGAIDSLKRARQLDPTHPGVLHNLGGVYTKWRQYDLAIESYEAAIELDVRAAIELDVNYTNARRDLSRVYLGTGDVESALQVLEKWVEDHPRSPEAHMYLGQAYQRIGETEKAQYHNGMARQLSAVQQSQ